MCVIRRLIYRLGLRPKPDSIFYSPTLSLLLACEGIGEAFKKGYDGYRDLPENGKYYSKADDMREGFGGAGEQ